MVHRRALPLSLCAILLTGCGASGPGTPTHPPIGNAQLTGSVHGGQQPIIGAAIQLYAVGTTGDASAATPLLTSTVTSDSTGSFTITGLYSCTSATQVYIVATGGNPGLSTANPQIALMAALGPCSSLTSSTFINIDELTTVAAVSALAPFMHSATTIGSSSSDAAALASAFTLANQFVDTSTGLAPGTNIPSGYTDPIAQLNTLADIVSACINSAGGAAGDTSLCGQLFTLTTVSPNPAPTNTIDALLNLADNPTQNTAALFNLTPPTPPFQPTLTSAPSDFLIQLIPPAGTTSLQIAPASISFPDTAVNTSSQPITVTLQNTGSTAVALNSIAISGTNSTDFSITNPTCGSSLNAGAFCSAQIVAKPSASGTRSASFVVTSSAPNSPQSIPLTVKGTVAAGSVTLTSSASFTILGALQDLTLTNTGSTAVNIASVTESDSGSSPYFEVAANNCGTSLAAQSSCTISILSSNSPSGAQPTTVTGTLTVTDDAGAQTATLSSTDVYAIEVYSGLLLVPGPGILTFPGTRIDSPATGTTIYYTPWVSSAIAPPLPLTLTGANPTDFTATVTNPGASSYASTCSDNYGYSEQCKIAYSFKPTAAGLRSAMVSLDPSFGPSTGQYILLEGTGVSGSDGFDTDLTSLTLQSFLPGNIDPKSTGAATITVTNIGIATLDLSASVTGTAAPYVTASVANCASVNPTSTCTVPVTFSASAPGTYTGTLTLTNVYGGSATLPITATTSYWPAVATPTSLNFGSITVGSTTSAQNFVIADPNGYPLGHAYTVSLQPSSNFQLTQGSTCPASTTQTCTLSAAFAPQIAGPISETATITDQTTNLTTQLALYGTGGAATYTLSTTGIVFPPVVSGATNAAPVSITLTATGTQPVSISGISITGSGSGSFSQTNNCSAIAPASTCTINVTFAPTSAGTPSATLQIAGNGVNSPTSVSLTGTASSSTGPALQISPVSITFPSTAIGSTSPAQSITITNNASGPVTLLGASLGTPSGATFAISSNTCSGTLTAGSSCTLSITATPSAASGSGSLVITSYTPGSPQTVPLSIVGTPGITSGGSTATLTPSPFTFTILGANKDFTLTNTGSTGLTVSNVLAETTGGLAQQHGYVYFNNTCTTPIGAGTACTFTVAPYITETLSSFAATPTTTTGQAIVLDDASNSPQTASILDSETAYLITGTGGVNGSGISGTITFPANQVGSTQTATIELANVTSGSPAATLAIGGANPGDFSVSALEPSVSSTPSTSCPGTGTAPCTITVTFKPTAIGTRSAKISLDSASTSTGQYIYVSGTAVAPGPSFTTNYPLSLTLGNSLTATSSTVTKAITVTNSGTTTLNLAAAITGANAGSFTADVSQCQSVAPQATCTINVTFSGTVVGNYYSASLLLYDQSSTASDNLLLYGTVADQAPTITFNPALEDSPYGLLFPNSQTVNTIGAPVSLTVNGYGDPVALSLSNANFILIGSSTCPAGSQPCTLSIAFSPASTGTLSTTLTATDTLTGKQTSVTIAGTATQ